MAKSKNTILRAKPSSGRFNKILLIDKSRSIVEKPESSRVAKTPSNNNAQTLRPQLFALSSTKILVGILVLAFLGFLDATYLTVLGLTREIPPCTVLHGCESVLMSRFAYVGPIPLALFGVGYFIVIMVLSILLLQKNSSRLRMYLFGLTSLAFLAGLVLIYIQGVILKAFCQYCLLAELIITLIFLLAGWVAYKGRNTEENK